MNRNEANQPVFYFGNLFTAQGVFFLRMDLSLSLIAIPLSAIIKKIINAKFTLAFKSTIKCIWILVHSLKTPIWDQVYEQYTIYKSDSFNDAS